MNSDSNPGHLLCRLMLHLLSYLYISFDNNGIELSILKQCCDLPCDRDEKPQCSYLHLSEIIPN